MKFTRSNYLFLLITLSILFEVPATGQNCSFDSFSINQTADNGNGTCDYEVTLSFSISNCNNNSGALDIIVTDGGSVTLYNNTFTNFCTASQVSFSVTANCGSTIELNTLFYDGPGGSDCDVITAPVGIPLPIELLSFEVSHEQEDLYFEWITLSEQNSEVFILEESRNGRDFYALESVRAAYESIERKVYTLQRPAVSSGLHYWRLKMLDFDGSFAYSLVVNKNIRRTNAYNFNFDKSSEFLHVSFDQPNVWDTDLQLWSNSGQLVKRQTLPAGVRSIEMTMLSLVPGMYYLTLGDLGTEKILVAY